jgi:hypothetical protein
VLTIGSEKITRSAFEQLVRGAPFGLSELMPVNILEIAPLPEQPCDPLGPHECRFGQFAGQLVNVKILAQEARARKLDQSAIKARVALFTEIALASAMYEELGKAKPDPTEVAAYYEQHKTEYQRIKLRQILIRTKVSAEPEKYVSREEALDKANNLRGKLLAGANFEELAQTQSDDDTTDTGHGTAFSVIQGQLPLPLEQVAFTLPVGQVSQPVPSEFGYTLLLVEERSVPPLDDIRESIESSLHLGTAKKGLAELKQKALVVYDKAYFAK